MAQNRDMQRVFVNTRVRLLVTCKGEVILISQSNAGLSMTVLQAVRLFVCLSVIQSVMNEGTKYVGFLGSCFSICRFSVKLHTEILTLIILMWRIG